MFRLAKTYSTDVDEFFPPGTDPYFVYNYVRDLPFIEDPEGIETVARPAFVLWRGWKNNRDCDDKSTAIAAYCESRKIPYRFAVVGENEDPALNPHHVYPELRLDGAFVPFDATYPERCVLGERLYEERFRKVFYP